MRVVFHDLDIIAGSTWDLAKGYLREELDKLASTINTAWDVSHNVDGTQRSSSLSTVLGQVTGTLAEQPTGLGVNDDALLFFVSDFGHMVRWNGPLNKWEFAPGDPGNGFFADFAIVPQTTGWFLCDGSATTYLTVGGAALGSSSFTTPNLNGTPTYRKSAGTYTGALIPAGGATSTGATASGVTGVGVSGGALVLGSVPVGLAQASDLGAPVFYHNHDIPSLTVPSLGVPALGIGSIDVAHLDVKPYFRR